MTNFLSRNETFALMGAVEDWMPEDIPDKRNIKLRGTLQGIDLYLEARDCIKVSGSEFYSYYVASIHYHGLHLATEVSGNVGSPTYSDIDKLFEEAIGKAVPNRTNITKEGVDLARRLASEL